MTDGEPGYCACCRRFHLLALREIPPLPDPLPVCRECVSLGDGEMAWRIARLDARAGLPPARQGRRPSRRLAESLVLGDAGGFGEVRRGIRWRAFIAWQRVRGRL